MTMNDVMHEAPYCTAEVATTWLLMSAFQEARTKRARDVALRDLVRHSERCGTPLLIRDPR